MGEHKSGIATLESYRVEQAPPTVYYVPNFISKFEEDYLLQQVYSAPKPKWTQLSGRRLQNWGGLPHPRGMLAEKIPEWLENYAEKISSYGVFDGKVANHVLVNEYNPGEGIMPHEDGPLYFPTVTTISLGSHTLLNFYHPVRKEEHDEEASIPQTEENRYFLSLLVEPRSLLILRDEMYITYLHGIKPLYEDTINENIANIKATNASIGDTLARSRRVSLTIRYVPKILKTTVFLGRKK